MTLRFDDNGWLIDAPPLLARTASYNLLAPEPASTFDAARLTHQATRFFALDLTVMTEKHYPAGGFPKRDAAHIRIARGDDAHELLVTTIPLTEAPAIAAQATDAAARIGAGFDVLVARATRLWQLPKGPNPHALALATVLASIHLAPILAPDDDATPLFGVKTARSLLSALGWRT